MVTPTEKDLATGSTSNLEPVVFDVMGCGLVSLQKAQGPKAHRAKVTGKKLVWVWRVVCWWLAFVCICGRDTVARRRCGGHGTTSRIDFRGEWYSSVISFQTIFENIGPVTDVKG